MTAGSFLVSSRVHVLKDTFILILRLLYNSKDNATSPRFNFPRPLFRSLTGELNT